MAFLDKLNGIAQSVGEKTSNAIESGKLTLKISGEEKKIAAAVVKLGEIFLAKLDAGEAADEETAAIYSEITACREVIAATQEEIENLKAAKESPEAARAPEEGVKFCPSCGTKLSADARFCPGCGKPQQ